MILTPLESMHLGALPIQYEENFVKSIFKLCKFFFKNDKHALIPTSVSGRRLGPVPCRR